MDARGLWVTDVPEATHSASSRRESEEIAPLIRWRHWIKVEGTGQ